MQVENHIVGTPCGVMDQMASACGEANKLLAMVCQVSYLPELNSSAGLQCLFIYISFLKHATVSFMPVLSHFGTHSFQ